MKITNATKAKMIFAFTTTFAVFALMLALDWRSFGGTWSTLPSLGAAVVIYPLMFALLPLVSQFSTERRAKCQAERMRWREHYRTSPEANLLNLHD
jgi:hypothetical protein